MMPEELGAGIAGRFRNTDIWDKSVLDECLVDELASNDRWDQLG
jgi:hypothetical protein